MATTPNVRIEATCEVQVITRDPNETIRCLCQEVLRLQNLLLEVNKQLADRHPMSNKQFEENQEYDQERDEELTKLRAEVNRQLDAVPAPRSVYVGPERQIRSTESRDQLVGRLKAAWARIDNLTTDLDNLKKAYSNSIEAQAEINRLRSNAGYKVDPDCDERTAEQMAYEKLIDEISKTRDSLRVERDTWKQRAEKLNLDWMADAAKIANLQARIDDLMDCDNPPGPAYMPEYASCLSLDYYAEMANKTESPIDEDMVTRFCRCTRYMIKIFLKLQPLIEELDKVKKFVYYNKRDTALMAKCPLIDHSDPESKYIPIASLLIPIGSSTWQQAELAVGLVHATLGSITECGESCDAALRLINGGLGVKSIVHSSEADEEEKILVNIAEEAGDQLWYLALAAKYLKQSGIWNGGCSLGSIADVNIQKLKKRYGEKFQQDRAAERDLEAEHLILTKAIAPAPVQVIYKKISGGVAVETTDADKQQAVQTMMTGMFGGGAAPEEEDMPTGFSFDEPEPATAHCAKCGNLVRVDEPHECEPAKTLEQQFDDANHTCPVCQKQIKSTDELSETTGGFIQLIHKKCKGS